MSGPAGWATTPPAFFSPGCTPIQQAADMQIAKRLSAALAALMLLQACAESHGATAHGDVVPVTCKQKANDHGEDPDTLLQRLWIYLQLDQAITKEWNTCKPDGK